GGAVDIGKLLDHTLATLLPFAQVLHARDQSRARSQPIFEPRVLPHVVVIGFPSSLSFDLPDGFDERRRFSRARFRDDEEVGSLLAASTNNFGDLAFAFPRARKTASQLFVAAPFAHGFQNIERG